jgi:shikimate kinase
MPSAPRIQPASVRIAAQATPRVVDGAGAPAPALESIHVVMVGLMGSGKTVVGRLIAAELGWRLSDSDPAIDEAVGLSAREIKEGKGVDALHRLEATHLLDALAASPPSVICAAASVVDSPACLTALREPGVCPVWLRARSETLAARFYREGHRPEYGEHPAAFLEDQIAARTPHLRDIAALCVDIDALTVPEVAAQVLELLREHVAASPSESGDGPA